MGDLLKLLLTFLSGQPPAIRAAGAIVLVACIGVPVGLKIRDTLTVNTLKASPAAPQIPSPGNQNPVGIGSGTYAGGTRTEPPGAAGQKVDGDSQQQALAQEHAAVWHNRHSGQDEPEWVYIEAGDRKENFVKYRFFKSSDGCVHVVRSQQGRPMDQWIMNPLPPHQLHADADPPSNQRQAGPASLTPLGPLSFFAALHAESVAPDSHAAGLDRHLMPTSAAGQCVNPHQGEFQWWWGPPTDQCWAPLYRKFPDGCQHFQMYNRCANAWDQRIQWQTCVH